VRDIALDRYRAERERLRILRQLDGVGLGHNAFTQPALDMIEAVRSSNKTIDIDNVNRVLLQPHWQKESDLVDF
jgi:hypothetical protein